MTAGSSQEAGLTSLDAARMLLSRLGICPEELLADSGTRPPAPVFADFIPRVSDAVSEGTRRAYSTYWLRIIDVWGERKLTEVTALDISQLAERTRASAVRRRNSRGGRSAAEHMLSALRCLYRHAVADGILADADNPAARVPKPRRLASTRSALASERLGELFEVAGSTGNDPELDTLLLRLHAETACRRGGALALQPGDLDVDQCLIQLREKGGSVRWQPVSPTLMSHLVAHGQSRGGLEPGRPLLRYLNGRPVTARRYDHLWHRLGRHLPWVAVQQVSAHWLRHTTLTWVERHFGYAVAQAYAGHASSARDPSATATYVRATRNEVAAALAALTGEPHPLAPASCPPTRDPSRPRQAPGSGDECVIPDTDGGSRRLC